MSLSWKFDGKEIKSLKDVLITHSHNFATSMSEMSISQSEIATWYSEKNFGVSQDTLARWPVEHLLHDIKDIKQKVIIVLQKYGCAPVAKHNTAEQEHSKYYENVCFLQYVTARTNCL
jgi:hypothetical protein